MDKGQIAAILAIESDGLNVPSAKQISRRFRTSELSAREIHIHATEKVSARAVAMFSTVPESQPLPDWRR